MKKDEIWELKKLIAISEIEKVFESLLVLIEQELSIPWSNEVIILSSNFNSLQKRLRLGMVSNEDYQVMKTKIEFSLLTNLDAIAEGTEGDSEHFTKAELKFQKNVNKIVDLQDILLKSMEELYSEKTLLTKETLFQLFENYEKIKKLERAIDRLKTEILETEDNKWATQNRIDDWFSIMERNYENSAKTMEDFWELEKARVQREEDIANSGHSYGTRISDIKHEIKELKNKKSDIEQKIGKVKNKIKKS
jgi:hypothetical protein